jgi:uncharacterized membrane protein YeaQ/YmgE (transglycosylase-associated protein family)
MFLSIILWFIFGLMTGLGAVSFLYKGDKRQVVPLITLGIVGGLIGGSFGQIITSTQADFRLLTPVISLMGAVLLIGLYKNISPQS